MMAVHSVARPEKSPAIELSTGTESIRVRQGLDGADGAAVRRRELAVFLRTLRERTSPSELGIVTSARRRTPGLRREEVALVAGMSVTWYTALEQARDVNPSTQVLDALARTMRLDRDERRHLYRLAGAANDAVAEEFHAVSDELRAVLDKLDPYPACIQNRNLDPIAHHNAIRLLITDLLEVPIPQSH